MDEFAELLNQFDKWDLVKDIIATELTKPHGEEYREKANDFGDFNYRIPVKFNTRELPSNFDKVVEEKGDERYSVAHPSDTITELTITVTERDTNEDGSVFDWAASSYAYDLDGDQSTAYEALRVLKQKYGEEKVRRFQSLITPYAMG